MATEVKLPEVGEGIDSGTVVGVLVKVGDQVSKDQALIELETDKAVVEVPSTVAGVVKQINVKENDQAAIGSVLVVIDEGAQPAAPAEAASAPAAAEAAAAAAPTPSPAPGAAPAAAAQTPAAKPPAATPPAAKQPAAKPPAGASSAAPAAEGGAAELERLVPAAPSVRRLARELGVDIHDVGGTGILGRVSAADVRGAVNGAGRAPVAAGAYAPAPQPLPDFSRFGATTRAPMSGVRKATLRAMSGAWGTVPMVTHFDKADITELELLRKRYQPHAEAVGAKLTPTAILLKVIGIALKRFPDFNASIDGDKLEIVHKQYVNVGVAVDTDAGLLVPVVKAVDTKSMIDLAVELGELAAKARDRKLTLDEMQGGNFSISNLGGIGGTGFTPIVNPPDVAILGVSRASVEPVWNKENAAFEPRTIMPLALTYDHRLIDGAAAARFLRWVCTALEDPFVVALEA